MLSPRCNFLHNEGSAKDEAACQGLLNRSSDVSLTSRNERSLFELLHGEYEPASKALKGTNSGAGLLGEAPPGARPIKQDSLQPLVLLPKSRTSSTSSVASSLSGRSNLEPLFPWIEGDPIWSPKLSPAADSAVASSASSSPVELSPRGDNEPAFLWSSSALWATNPHSQRSVSDCCAAASAEPGEMMPGLPTFKRLRQAVKKEEKEERKKEEENEVETKVNLNQTLEDVLNAIGSDNEADLTIKHYINSSSSEDEEKA